MIALAAHWKTAKGEASHLLRSAISAHLRDEAGEKCRLEGSRPSAWGLAVRGLHGPSSPRIAVTARLVSSSRPPPCS